MDSSTRLIPAEGITSKSYHSGIGGAAEYAARAPWEGGKPVLLGWLTFASATIAAVLQGRKAAQGWIYDRRDRMELKRVTRAGWSSTGVNTWQVGLANKAETDSDGRPVTVTVLVLNKGLPSADQAARLRRDLGQYDLLSRNPTPDAPHA